MFNEDLLTWYREPSFKEQHMKMALLPDIINAKEEYKVEEVYNCYKKWGYSTQFLVHWKGYKNEYNQWIVETGLPHTKEAIQDYWTKLSR